MHQGSDPMVNTDAKKSTTRGMGGEQYQAEIGCPKLAKNTFAIKHLLYHSIV